MVIFDKKNKPLYYFDARLVTERSDINNTVFNYSGVFHCRLVPFEYKSRSCISLFQNVKNATRDWQSDARFCQEINGIAGAPSSRFLVQRCKVRGMYIEMEINNVVADKNGGIQSMDFKITFLNDQTATSEISDEKKVMPPSRLASIYPQTQ